MADFSQFTQLSVPLARSVPNFAPAEPLIKLLQDKKPSKTPSRFEKTVKEKYDEKMAIENGAWLEIYSMSQLVSLFRQGQQLLVRRPFGAAGYYVRPIQNDDTYRETAMNLMTFHAQVCESKIVASNPKILIRAGDDSPEAIASAQACRPVIDCYETEWYTSKFTRREAVDLLTNGMFIHICRWNPFKGGKTARMRQVNQIQRQTDDGMGECAECQMTGSAEDFSGGQCPECGSNLIDIHPPTMANLSQISLGDAVPVGEPELIRTSLLGWRWDLAVDLEESSWAIRRQRISQGAVNLMLGDVVIPDSVSSQDYGLDMLRILNTSGMAWAGQSRQAMYGYGGVRGYDTRPTMAECWFGAEDQAEIELDETITVSGQRLPKGRMSDIFHGDPVCIVGVNDMSAIIGVFPKETHQTQVVTGQWIMQSDTGIGRGMEDAAAVQKRSNAVDGQVYQGLAASATPAAITDLSIFKEDQGDYLFRPGINVDVNLALLPPNMSLKDAFYQPPAGQVNPQYIQYGSTYLRQMFQLSAFVTEFTDGLIGVDNRTATGAQITAALANSLYGPMLATKGQARVRIAEIVIELYAQHCPTGRYFAGKGNARGRDVSGRDLKGKVIFELIQNSELPVTPFSQQTDVRVFFEAFGGAPIASQLKKQDPEFFRATSLPFNIDWGNDSDDDISTLCLERLEQMRDALMAGVDDPQLLVQSIQPPVEVAEPKHPEKSLWFSLWLDLQAGQSAPLVLRQAAVNMYHLHQNYAAQKDMPQSANQGLVAGVGAAAAQAPAALGGALVQKAGADAGQAADQAHEHQQKERDRELQASQELAKQEHETKLKAMEGQIQMAVTKQQGKNQMAASDAKKYLKAAGGNKNKARKLALKGQK